MLFSFFTGENIFLLFKLLLLILALICFDLAKFLYADIGVNVACRVQVTF